jgi:hypothetical protein
MATIRVTRDPSPLGSSASSCAASASVLWKPVNLNRIAVYAVGCDPTEAPDDVHFRLKILDEPSLLARDPFKILP